jgi:hypothetical protein
MMMMMMMAAISVAYYTDNGYLTRMRWRDGDLGYCKPCDGETPLVTNRNGWLCCPLGHKQHPLTLLVARSGLEVD